jgi:hypothetical protein
MYMMCLYPLITNVARLIHVASEEVISRVLLGLVQQTVQLVDSWSATQERERTVSAV